MLLGVLVLLSAVTPLLAADGKVRQGAFGA